MDLFDLNAKELKNSSAPLAERMRPESLDLFVGQEHLTGKEKLLAKMVRKKDLYSLILWGPPGTGKTTLANIIAKASGAHFVSFSAVLAGVKDIREVIKEAQNQLKYHQKKTILFVDEIHRFNKAQQDAFLHHVEDGTITLIGATTENPSFEVNAPLLSRCKVLVLNPLAEEDIEKLLKRALNDEACGLKKLGVKIANDTLAFINVSSHGDARVALNTLEVAAMITTPDTKGIRHITIETAQEALQKKAILYDKGGEEHYNVISAFIKSMRGSDPDAALYWLARMLEAGEDPLFVVRRMVIFASEDIGNADPMALQVAVSVKDAYHFVGMPEGWIPLAQGVTYLASAPKSNASYMAYKSALKDVKEKGALPVPLHIRNAPTKLMKNLNYGKDYKYPHNYEEGHVDENYLPEKLKSKTYYFPKDSGKEKEIKERLEQLRKGKK
ncbi:MAG: replication-associated recombination protein A [Thermodesulfobacteriota bacterium]